MHKRISFGSAVISYRLEGPAPSAPSSPSPGPFPGPASSLAPATVSSSVPASSSVQASASQPPALLLIHGFAEDSRIWDGQIAFLQHQYRLIIPDLPGCGASSPLSDTTAGIGLETCADILAAILDNENIPAAILIGHSMGGYITLAFIDKFPQRLIAAGLFHSTAYPDTEEKKTARRKSNEFIKKNGSAPFIRQSIPNLFAEATRSQNPDLVSGLIERYAGFDPQSLIAYNEAMIKRPDRSQQLKSLPYPFLFIAGRHDNAVPINSLLSQTYLPALSHIHILERAGHLGMLEEAEESNRILAAFLQFSHFYNYNAHLS